MVVSNISNRPTLLTGNLSKLLFAWWIFHVGGDVYPTASASRLSCSTVLVSNISKLIDFAHQYSFQVSFCLLVDLGSC
jgi:hypothetical protein